MKASACALGDGVAMSWAGGAPRTWRLPSWGGAHMRAVHPKSTHTQRTIGYGCPVGEGQGAVRACNRGRVCRQEGAARVKVLLWEEHGDPEAERKGLWVGGVGAEMVEASPGSA